MAPNGQAVDGVTTVIGKKRRVRFNSVLGKTVTKSVKFYSAHSAPHGKSQKLYERALAMFVRECNIDGPKYQLS